MAISEKSDSSLPPPSVMAAVTGTITDDSGTRKREINSQSPLPYVDETACTHFRRKQLDRSEEHLEDHEIK